eukprot:6893441-Prymnesium_polylepis.1
MASSQHLPLALWHEAAQGKVSAVAEYILEGGDVDAVVDGDAAGLAVVHQSTLLIIASGQGHDEMVHLLLDAGATVDVQDVKGFTALMHATCACRLSAARVLLEAGARPDLTDVDGMSALDWVRAERSN